MTNQSPNPRRSPSAYVWQWSYPRTERDNKRRLLHAGGLAILGTLCLAYALITAVTSTGNAVSAVRFPLVFGAISLSLAAMGDAQTRRARSTTMSIDNLGLLTITDNQSSSTLDLCTSSVPDVRVRAGSQYSKASIEAISPSGPWHRELASIAGNLRLGTEEIHKLQVELHKWSIWASGGKSVALAKQSISARKQHPSIGSTPATPFTWTPPRHPNAARNQRRFRVGSALGLGALAIGIAASQWENGLDDVVISMFVPVLLLLFGFGLDRSYAVGQNFLIHVDRSTLTVTKGNKTLHAVPLASIRQLEVDASAQASTTQTSQRHIMWYLRMEVEPEPLKVQIPRGLGSGFSKDAAIQLEADLNRFI